MKNVTLVAVVMLTAAASFGAGLAVAKDDPAPFRPPPWISSDGKLDLSKAPARISVGLPDRLMAKSPDGWGWADSELLLGESGRVVAIPVYPTEQSELPIGYFDRRTGAVTEEPLRATPGVTETTEVSK